MGCSGFKPSPAPLNDLNKSAATDHTVCVFMDLIVEITCDCVVCICNDSMGPRKSSLWLSGSPRKMNIKNKQKNYSNQILLKCWLVLCSSVS